MPLHGYGLLIGKIVGSRPQQGKSPHFLLFLQPKAAGHPPYRVAVNLGAPGDKTSAGVEYQVVDFKKNDAFVQRLRALGQTENFLRADADPKLPRLDYVRGGVIDPGAFKAMARGTNPLTTAFEKALDAAAKSGAKGGALVAVFGTGYPINQKTGAVAPTGFEGIENIHMNQGSFNAVGGTEHYLENGANQDGGLVFLTKTGATGFFVKFKSQSVTTDVDGRPVETGVPELDRTPQAVRDAIMPPAAAAKRKPRPKPSPNGPPGFVFADTDPNDADQPYVADDDDQNRKAPYVVTLATGKTRGPVPKPRSYPRLDLSTVVGDSPAGYSKSADAETITFDLLGDSGAPSAKKLPGEHSVADLMVRDAAKSRPAFLFHVGDVVYFYGEKDYYYSQFYEPFRSYPAPIFAIPGNHDGITYGPDMVSLGPFQKAFCATTPARWEGSGGILRTSMIQPGVYFTLDAPLVSVIGLYSNCGESLGWLDDQQLLYLHSELVRLKTVRAREGRAVILAIHHCPRWFPDRPKPDSTSDAIDRACHEADFWPDAVVCGHAHLYQRIVRQDGGRDVPYIINGGGGYGLNALQETAKTFVSNLSPKLAKLLIKEGYVRVTVTKPRRGAAKATLKFEYRSIKPTTDQPDDVCAVDLGTNKLI